MMCHRREVYDMNKTDYRHSYRLDRTVDHVTVSRMAFERRRPSLGDRHGPDSFSALYASAPNVTVLVQWTTGGRLVEFPREMSVSLTPPTWVSKRSIKPSTPSINLN